MVDGMALPSAGGMRSLALMGMRPGSILHPGSCPMHVEIHSDPVPPALYAGEKRLRDAVLRKPLGMALGEMDTATDAEQVHFLVLEGGEVIACALGVRHGPDAFQIRQMAVSSEWQGKGVGASLLKCAEEWIKEQHGATLAWLNARHYAVAFYEKCGYRITSDAFVEVGMPHFRMEKAL